MFLLYYLCCFLSFFSGVISQVSSQKETSSLNFCKDQFSCSVALNLRI